MLHQFYVFLYFRVFSLRSKIMTTSLIDSTLTLWDYNGGHFEFGRPFWLYDVIIKILLHQFYALFIIRDICVTLWKKILKTAWLKLILLFLSNIMAAILNLWRHWAFPVAQIFGAIANFDLHIHVNLCSKFGTFVIRVTVLLFFVAKPPDYS